MVAFSGAALDYEFVIWLFGWRELGFPEFVPWSASKPASSANPSINATCKDRIMKTSTLIAAIAVSFAATGAAIAQEATYELPQPATSSVTRAQVQSELAQARANGSLLVTEADYQRSAPFTSGFSRDAVRAQTLEAIARGEMRQLNAEPMASTWPPRAPGPKPPGSRPKPPADRQLTVPREPMLAGPVAIAARAWGGFLAALHG